MALRSAQLPSSASSLSGRLYTPPSLPMTILPPVIIMACWSGCVVFGHVFVASQAKG